ncbi:MAG: hemerythrin domain-containing protein, partial [Bacteroidales bacterium]|nr:hemerythrin domain-containing protein [Bacteroidales bacterium]
MYKATDKMSEIICDNASLLLVMSRFGISLGFGDDNVQQVCSRQNVDLSTFLAVINFLSDNTNRIVDYGGSLSVDA